ncbi:IS3 family transposase [Amedibacillus dolichus]|uniref:IS3 family transposase n=1 Tax=Amedibacillus dolichus TaxID=31971 RepID=A0ABT7UEB2_9FIRM|nr:IS3 family transposase [Amedibacillus dolichus]MDM8157968.1 IS3 family transposase [Amedibacillus dolichus]
MFILTCFQLFTHLFLHSHEFTSIEHLIQEVENYIYYYNNERIQVKLKGLTPVQYRNQSL